jgi:hypothetical protein
MNRMCVLVAIVLVALCATSGMALTRMGAPAGTLGAGKWNIGVDYTYSKENFDFTDLKAGGVDIDPELTDGTAKDVKSQFAMARLEYGLADKWDIYGLLGGAQVKGQAEDEEVGDLLGEVKSSWEMAYGGGTRFTFYQDGPWTLGALGQVVAVNNLSDTINGGTPGDTFSDDISVDILQAQIAVGPTYQLMEGVKVYGGPFGYFMTGNFEDKSVENEGGVITSQKVKADLEEAAWFGGYIGTEVSLCKDISASVEYQRTAFAYSISGNIAWKF